MGLYWYGSADSHVKAQDDRPSELYDPSKPTMIFFHGWSGRGDGWTTNCQRLTGACTEDLCPGASGQLLFEPWIAKGWNVGIFYWDQFADESCIRDAEQKIYFDRSGNGLRWKSYNYTNADTLYGQYMEDTYSVADICDQVLSATLARYSGPEVRFVGHSIGAQLAVRCASMLHFKNHPAAPNRMALLDPYFSKHHLWLFRCLGEDVDKTKVSMEGGLQDYAAVQTADTVSYLYNEKAVFTEVYKTSPLTELSQYGVPNTELDMYATLVEYNPNWCGGVGALSSLDLAHFKCRHDAAIPVYFLGFALPPPQIMASPPSTTLNMASAIAACQTPSASCGTPQLAQWVKRQRHLNGQQKWVQTQGMEMLDVQTDIFSLFPDIATAANAGDQAANVFIEEVPPALPARKVSMTMTQKILHNGRLFFALIGIVICCGFYCMATNAGSEPGESTVEGTEEEGESPYAGSRAGDDFVPLMDARELGFKRSAIDSRAGRVMS